MLVSGSTTFKIKGLGGWVLLLRTFTPYSYSKFQAKELPRFEASRQTTSPRTRTPAFLNKHPSLEDEIKLRHETPRPYPKKLTITSEEHS